MQSKPKLQQQPPHVILGQRKRQKSFKKCIQKRCLVYPITLGFQCAAVHISLSVRLIQIDTIVKICLSDVGCVLRAWVELTNKCNGEWASGWGEEGRQWVMYVVYICTTCEWLTVCHRVSLYFVAIHSMQSIYLLSLLHEHKQIHMHVYMYILTYICIF